MWLQKIVVKNFKPYREKVEITFDRSCSQLDKHIFVIYGDNGFGKTSLLDAIYWGLFGQKARKTQLLFNDKEAKKKKTEMFVELTFYDEVLDSTYVIFRKATKNGNTIHETLEVIVNGESILGDSLYKQDHIEQHLIPYEISRFFFFDAEDVKTLAREQGGEMVKDSVELLLGLKAIRESIEDLSSVREELEKQRKKHLKEEDKLQEIGQKLDEISKKLKSYKEQYEKSETELKKKKEKMAQLRKELAEFGHEEIKRLTEKREQLESKLRALMDEKGKIKKDLEEISANIHLLILKSEVVAAKRGIEKKLEELQKKQEELRELSLRTQFLERLLEESRCPICGRIPLEMDVQVLKTELEELKKEHPLASEKLKEIEMKYSKYYHLRSQLIQKLETIEHLSTNDIYELRIKLREKEEEIADVQKQIKKISETLKNAGISLVSQIESKISNLQYEIGRLEGELKRLSNEIEKLEVEKRKLEKKLKIYTSKGSELSEIEAKIEFVDTIKAALEDYLEIMVEKRRNDIIRTSSDIFLELTNKKEEYVGFEFSSQNNYKFQIVCKDGSRPNMDTISYGEMEVVALSFILGLSKYSQIKAPIITDTLFGRLSPYVQENIAKLFSEMDNQIVLLVLKDERPNGKTEIDPIAPIFKHKICKEFIIQRNQINRESSIFEGKVLVGD